MSLQGSDVATNSNFIKTDPGVAPLHSHPVAIDDELVANALLSQPMPEVDISRLESIYGATESVSFDTIKVRLEIRKNEDYCCTSTLN